MAVFARTSCAELEAALSAALEGAALPAFDWLRQPQIGLAMVRARIGGTGDRFNLGEATVTRATLRLRGEGVAGTIGVACHLGRDKRRAELAAIADALLQQPGHHPQLHARLVEPLAARIADAQTTQREQVASTRVEFFTMVRGDA
jgi:alpha-D-ribose 1-methylphosphonate 5-triphosphate synthase subunit PhnG